MHFHWQNLKSDHPGRWGSHGRAWWHLSHRKVIGLEWSAPANNLHLSVTINEGDGNDDLQVSLGCLLFAFWLTVPFFQFRIGHVSQYLKKPLFVHEERHFNLGVHGWALWLTIWGDDGWVRDRPWWRNTISFHPVDFFLGREKCVTEEKDTQEVLIPMPEGCYPARVTLGARYWTRARWPWAKRLDYYSVDIEGGIPFEGKGENSWDCGEDGLWGTGGPGHDIPNAIAETVKSVLKTRQRYGGKLTHRDLVSVMAPPRKKLEQPEDRRKP